jgi:hypothetical protein
MVALVVCRESPTAQPSVAESMYIEFSFGFAGGLMYEFGVMSLHTPITALSAETETANTRTERTIITTMNRVLCIATNY